jgi:hypothetical protein
MTKKFLVATSTFAIAIACVSGLSSCQDEDLGVSETVLKERAFEQGFTKAFGQPSADQSWDFYAQKMNGIDIQPLNVQEGEEVVEDGETEVTRATMATLTVNPDALGDYLPQPASVQALEEIWHPMLPESTNNGTKGQNTFSLISSGKFTVSAVWYGGGIEINDYGIWPLRTSGFGVGIRYTDENGDTQDKLLFGAGTEEGANPGFAKEVTLTPGAEFEFFISFWVGLRNYIYTTGKPPNLVYDLFSRYDSPAQLLYSGESESDKFMIIGFEDDWRLLDVLINDFDFNDVVLIISGNLPVTTPKRFLAEDLYSLDFDYNDAVFDVSNTGITLRAVGGTLPIYLQVQEKGKHNPTTTGELHELLGGETYVDKAGNTFYCPINVGGPHGITKDPVKIMTWTEKDGTRLTNDELKNFNGVSLLVASEFGQSGSALTNVEDFTEVNTTNPAILAVPDATDWMKELTRIDKGYPNFYQNNWYETSVSENLYHE